MLVKNSTIWNTADLRKLFFKCIKEVEKIEKPSHKFARRKRIFKLEIMNTQGGCRGRATVNGYWIMIKIDKHWATQEELSEEQRLELAKLIIHEYYHTIGFRYHDRCHYKRDFTAKWLIDWIKDYPIKKKILIKKPKTDLKDKRYQQALANLARAITKKKRAETLYKKWLAKVKYYEKFNN